MEDKSNLLSKDLFVGRNQKEVLLQYQNKVQNYLSDNQQKAKWNNLDIRNYVLSKLVKIQYVLFVLAVLLFIISGLILFNIYLQVIALTEIFSVAVAFIAILLVVLWYSLYKNGDKKEEQANNMSALQIQNKTNEFEIIIKDQTQNAIEEQIESKLKNVIEQVENLQIAGKKTEIAKQKKTVEEQQAIIIKNDMHANSDNVKNITLNQRNNKGWSKINANHNILGYLLDFFSYRDVNELANLNRNMRQAIKTKEDWSEKFQNQRKTECQILFEIGVLLRMDISKFDGTKPVKTINFPPFESSQNFLPDAVSGDNILWIFKKFNERFVRPINEDDYKKYSRLIEDQENPACFFVSYNPKSFDQLCKNLIKSAGYTEEKLKNMKFPGWPGDEIPKQETVKAECRTENSY